MLALCWLNCHHPSPRDCAPALPPAQARESFSRKLHLPLPFHPHIGGNWQFHSKGDSRLKFSTCVDDTPWPWYVKPCCVLPVNHGLKLFTVLTCPHRSAPHR